MVHGPSQQNPLKRSRGGFCLKRGFSQPDLFIAWLQKRLCQQKAGGAMGVGRGGWRWEQPRCWLRVANASCGFALASCHIHPVTASRGTGAPTSVPAHTAPGPCFGCCPSTAACRFWVCLCCLVNRVQMGPACPKAGSQITRRTAPKAAPPSVPTGSSGRRLLPGLLVPSRCSQHRPGPQVTLTKASPWEARCGVCLVLQKSLFFTWSGQRLR